MYTQQFYNEKNQKQNELHLFIIMNVHLCIKREKEKMVFIMISGGLSATSRKTYQNVKRTNDSNALDRFSQTISIQCAHSLL